MPTTIRDWMEAYNALIDIATVNGVQRGPGNTRLRRLSNLRVSNNEARDRVRGLFAFLRGVPEIPSLDLMRIAPPSIQLQQSNLYTRPQASFGVEIEALIPVSISSGHNHFRLIADILSVAGIPTKSELYNHHIKEYWKITTDNSLRSEIDTVACEIVSPPLPASTIGLEQVRKVGEILVGLNVLVNRSCGFHIHVGIKDYADHDTNFFKNLISIYHSNLAIIEKILAPSRRGGNNIYCRDLRSFSDAALKRCRTIKEVTTLVNGPDFMHDRHFKINVNSYHRYRTVEFRQHQGTIDPQKMVMWIRFCQRLVSAAATTSTTDFKVESLEKLLSLIQADEEECSYFLARQAYFHRLETNGDL